MKRQPVIQPILAGVLCLLLVMSVPALGENAAEEHDQEPSSSDDNDTEGTLQDDDEDSLSEDPTSDQEDDSEDDVSTGDEVEEELEEELEDIETISPEEEEEILEELEDAAEADDEALMESADLTEEDLQLLSEVNSTVGHRQYVLNLQLQKRIQASLIAMDVVLSYAANATNTSGNASSITRLIEIRDELALLSDGLGEKNLTRDEFAKTLAEVRTLVKKFRKAAAGLFTPTQRHDIQEAIKKRLKEEDLRLGQLIRRERALRHYLNKLEERKLLRQIMHEVREILKAEGRLFRLSERLKKIHELRKRYLSGEATSDDLKKFREELKEDLKEYNKEKREVAITARRAEALHDALAARQRLREAQASGKNTTELEADFEKLRSELKQASKLSQWNSATKESLLRLKERSKNLKEKTEALRERGKEIKERAENMVELRKETRERIAKRLKESSEQQGTNSPNVSSGGEAP